MSKKSLLIIDDDVSLCKLLEAIFKASYKVTVKHDTVSAMYWLTEGNSVDLIISDLNLPDLSGLDLIKFTKNSGIFKDIPFMVLSGSENHRKECSENGIEYYVVKPFDPEVLLDKVNGILKETVGS